MAQSVTQVSYEVLKRIAKDFHQESEDITQIHRTTSEKMDTLQSGWNGEAADAFFAEMNNMLLPSTDRLARALLTSETTLNQIAQIFHEADAETVSYYKNLGGEAVAPSDGSITGPGTGAGDGSSPGSGEPKAYLIPPFKFGFEFELGGMHIDRSIDFAGLSPQDWPWAENVAETLDDIVTVIDGLGVVTSGISLGLDGLTNYILPLTATVVPEAALLIPFTKGAGAFVSGFDIGLGIDALLLTGAADVLQGETGWVIENDGTLGLALGRDTFVSGRNFTLGTIMNIASVYAPPGVSTLTSAAGLYISLSQFDYDLESQMGYETGGQMVLSGLDNESLLRALNGGWEQCLDDWFIVDKSPGLESAVVRKTGTVISEIGKDIDEIGRRIYEWGEEWGESAP